MPKRKTDISPCQSPLRRNALYVPAYVWARTRRNVVLAECFRALGIPRKKRDERKRNVVVGVLHELGFRKKTGKRYGRVMTYYTRRRG